jgi:predicted DNA-binding protein
MKKAFRRGGPHKRVRVKAAESETVACRMPIEMSDKLRAIAQREERTLSFVLLRLAREALEKS